MLKALEKLPLQSKQKPHIQRITPQRGYLCIHQNRWEIITTALDKFKKTFKHFPEAKNSFNILEIGPSISPAQLAIEEAMQSHSQTFEYTGLEIDPRSKIHYSKQTELFPQEKTFIEANSFQFKQGDACSEVFSLNTFDLIFCFNIAPALTEKISLIFDKMRENQEAVFTFPNIEERNQFLDQIFSYSIDHPSHYIAYKNTEFKDPKNHFKLDTSRSEYLKEFVFDRYHLYCSKHPKKPNFLGYAIILSAILMLLYAYFTSNSSEHDS